MRNMAASMPLTRPLIPSDRKIIERASLELLYSLCVPTGRAGEKACSIQLRPLRKTQIKEDEPAYVLLPRIMGFQEQLVK